MSFEIVSVLATNCKVPPVTDLLFCLNKVHVLQFFHPPDTIKLMSMEFQDSAASLNECLIISHLCPFSADCCDKYYIIRVEKDLNS